MISPFHKPFHLHLERQQSAIMAGCSNSFSVPHVQVPSVTTRHMYDGNHYNHNHHIYHIYHIIKGPPPHSTIMNQLNIATSQTFTLAAWSYAWSWNMEQCETWEAEIERLLLSTNRYEMGYLQNTHVARHSCTHANVNKYALFWWLIFTCNDWWHCDTVTREQSDQSGKWSGGLLERRELYLHFTQLPVLNWKLQHKLELALWVNGLRVRM